MSNHTCGVLGLGFPLPPLSTEPMKWSATSPGEMHSLETWVIWPIISGTVISRSRRSMVSVRSVVIAESLRPFIFLYLSLPIRLVVRPSSPLAL